jgi:hypothetical protein
VSLWIERDRRRAMLDPIDEDIDHDQTIDRRQAYLRIRIVLGFIDLPFSGGNCSNSNLTYESQAERFG